MLKKSVLLLIPTIIFIIGSFSNSQAQTTQTVTLRGAGEMVRPADEAKIESSILDYKLKETNLEYLQTLPLPELKFVFDSKTIKYDGFSEDVKTILNEHWKAAIKYFYDERFNKPTEGQDAFEKTMDWAVYCNKTHKELQRQIIETPNGKRNISQTEAKWLWGSLNRAAVNIIDRVEIIKSKS